MGSSRDGTGCIQSLRRQVTTMRIRCMYGSCGRKKTVLMAIVCGVCLFFLHGKISESYDGQTERQRRSERGIFSFLQSFKFGGGSKPKSTGAVYGAIYRDITGNFEPPREPSRHGVGEMGMSVTFEDWEKAAVENSVREYAMNMYGSDKISLDRSLPDLRDPQCKHWHYLEDLPQVSVVIAFHDEGWSTLIRTVHSVINRSPPYLLKEILLVDDYSTRKHLRKQLDDYIKTVKLAGIVKLIRTRKREGVIGARMYGFTRASAPVIVSMDAHCEVGTNWLAPLLSVLATNRTSIAVPIIDIIDNMDYRLYPQGSGRLARGMFDWNMDYKRVQKLPDRERKARRYKTEPYRSPAFSGTVFAMYKSYFLELGGFDLGLKMYGGENFELSLKNIARVAEVWMDEYKDYLYASRPYMRAPSFNIGDVSRQVLLRREKKCQSFGWYLNEVAYDLTSNYPLPPKLVVTGEIRGLDTEFCLDTKNKVPVNEGVELTMYKCHGMGGNQFFRLTTAGDIRVNDLCLGQRAQTVIITACNSPNVITDWQYNQEKSTLMRRSQHKCLERAGLKIQVSSCGRNYDPQLWTFDDPFLLDTLVI
ncbi:N-acetylgalactosaminyltransferase 7-like [Asterias rubens]|uniref:N-acetylgalactosaminyltransferase 7-like n=1 Tax=Asterias rubens TaxID=7604 RepID=UPI0014553195|nr:N-acetylgalactosaminyltransferase 7-like [Asterias rubens]